MCPHCIGYAWRHLFDAIATGDERALRSFGAAARAERETGLPATVTRIVAQLEAERRQPRNLAVAADPAPGIAGRPTTQPVP